MIEQRLRIASGNWIGRILLVMSLVLVAAYVGSSVDWETVRNIQVDPLWLSLAALTNFLYLLTYALIWHGLTRIGSLAVPLPDALAIWLFSNFGKYLPLKVAGIGYRLVEYNRRTGKTYAEIGQSCYMEFLATILGGFLFVLVIIALLGRQELVSRNAMYLYLAVVVVLSLIMLPPVQHRMFAAGMRLLGRNEVIPKVNGLTSVILVAGYATSWIIVGTALYCLVRALYEPLDLHSLPNISLVYASAGLAGMLSIFAPSGIGVREGVMMFGLSTIVPPPIAAVATISARILTTSIEWVGILLGFMYLELAKRDR